MPGHSRSRRRQPRTLSRPLLFALVGGLAVITLALVVAVLANRTAPDSGPVAGVTDQVETRTPISLLSDSHAYNANSWWRQTMEARTIDGAQIGAWQSQPGASAAVLQERLDAATAEGGLVIVQAGTNDFYSALTPVEVIANIEALWDGIEARGGTPVAALVPPSQTYPAQTVELNALISQAAAARGLAVIDVYTAVAAPDGSWPEGLSDDGVHANDEAAAIMAEAARPQLEALLG